MKNEQGLTLTEILASIVILSVIIVTFLLMFAQSSQTTSKSKEILDATYYAETEMEEIIRMHSNIKPTSRDDLSKEIIESKDSDISVLESDSHSYSYGLKKEDHYVTIELKDLSSDLVKVILRIYKDESRINQKEKAEAQMEMILSIRGAGK